MHHALWKNYKFQFFTSERILPKYWNQEEQAVRRSHPKSQEINNYLDGLNEKVKTLYRGYLADGIIPVPALLKNDLKPASTEVVKTETKNISAVYAKYMHSLQVRGFKQGTVKYYQNILNLLDSFQREYGDVDLENFNNAVFDEFVECLVLK